MSSPFINPEKTCGAWLDFPWRYKNFDVGLQYVFVSNFFVNRYRVLLFISTSRYFAFTNDILNVSSKFEQLFSSSRNNLASSSDLIIPKPSSMYFLHIIILLEYFRNSGRSFVQRYKLAKAGATAVLIAVLFNCLYIFPLDWTKLFIIINSKIRNQNRFCTLKIPWKFLLSVRRASEMSIDGYRRSTSYVENHIGW